MSFHADTMTGAMREIRAVTGFFNDLPGGFVHFRTGNAGSPGFPPRVICLLDDLMDFMVFIVHIANCECSGEIRDSNPDTRRPNPPPKGPPVEVSDRSVKRADWRCSVRC